MVRTWLSLSARVAESSFIIVSAIIFRGVKATSFIVMNLVSSNPLNFTTIYYT